jgi:hypothetical protein
LLVSLLWLSACSGPEQPMMMAPSTDPCAPIGRSENGVCVSQIGFQSGPALPRPRDHHGTAIAETSRGAFLYITGGTHYTGVFDDVAVAPIAADGSLGPFVATTPMPSRRAGHGIVVHGGRLFVAGGQNNGGFLATVTSAPIHEDGTLGAWEEEPSLPAGRFHLGVVASKTHLYAIGGVKSDNHEFPFIATSMVAYAPFLSDGRLGPFVSAADLPEPRSHHALVVHGDALYLLGGLVKDTANGSPMARDVLVSRLDGGVPGPFTVAGKLADPVATVAAFELQGFLYIVGGLTEDDAYSARITRAPLQGDGMLGEPADVGELPEARSHVHHTPYHDGRMYTTGGSIDYHVVTDAVWVGTFSPPAAAAPLGQTSHALRRAPRQGAARCPCRARISIPN